MEAFDFNMAIPYPAKILNSFIVYINFIIDSLKLYMYNIISCAKRDSFTSLSILKFAINFSYLTALANVTSTDTDTHIAIHIVILRKYSSISIFLSTYISNSC